MKTNIPKFALPFLFIVINPLYSLAWGVLGHRVTGEIAESYLTAHTRREIKKILGNESLAMASNWADFIKSDRSYDYLGRWHYVNIPSGLSESECLSRIASDTAPNIYNRILFLTSELRKKNLSPDKKLFYLKLLVHFVGDAHQPMHAGRPGDKGGNSIRLFWFSTPTNLHRVWDEQLIEFQQLSYTEHCRAINFTTSEQRQEWQKAAPGKWIFESYQIAEKLYNGVKPDDKLSYNYNFQHMQTINDRLLKGGVRLAGLLNEIFRS